MVEDEVASRLSKYVKCDVKKIEKQTENLSIYPLCFLQEAFKDFIFTLIFTLWMKGFFSFANIKIFLKH